MIEAEGPFDVADDIALAEDYLKYCVAAALCRCADDLEFFEGSKNEGLRDRLKAIVETPFKRRVHGGHRRLAEGDEGRPGEVREHGRDVGY